MSRTFAVVRLSPHLLDRVRFVADRLHRFPIRFLRPSPPSTSVIAPRAAGAGAAAVRHHAAAADSTAMLHAITIRAWRLRNRRCTGLGFFRIPPAYPAFIACIRRRSRLSGRGRLLLEQLFQLESERHRILEFELCQSLTTVLHGKP